MDRRSAGKASEVVGADTGLVMRLPLELNERKQRLSSQWLSAYRRCKSANFDTVGGSLSIASIPYPPVPRFSLRQAELEQSGQGAHSFGAVFIGQHSTYKPFR